MVKMLLGSDNLIVDCPDRSVEEFILGRLHSLVLECMQWTVMGLIMVLECE